MAVKKLFYLWTLVMLVSSTLFGASVGLTKVADVAGPVTSGETFFYTLKYSCDDITTDCSPNAGDVVITDDLNESLELVKSYHPSGFAHNSSGNTQTWTIDTLVAGTTGEIRMKVRVKSGEVADGSVISNEATSTVDGANAVTSNSVDVTVNSAPHWTLSKTEAVYDEFHSGTYADADKNVSYTMQLCPDTTIGNLDLSDVTMVDTFSSDVVAVENADGGTVDLGANTITWSAFDATVAGGCVSKTVTLDYNDAAVGSTVNNEVDVTATPLGETANSLALHADVGNGPLDAFVFNPVGRMSVDKKAEVVENSNYDWIRDDQLSQAYTAKYTLTAKSTGNIGILDFNVTDGDINTSKLHVTSINTGTNSDNRAVSVYYKTDPADAWTYHGDVAVGTAIDTSAISFITNILFAYGDVPKDFTASPIIEAQMQDTSNGAQTLPLDYTFDNCADVNDHNNTNVAGFPSNKHACAAIDVRNNFSYPKITKSASSSEVGIDEQITYTLKVENSDEGTGIITDPIVVDVLPADFEYVAGSATFDAGNSAGGSNTVAVTSNLNAENLDSSEGKFFQWDLTGTLERGEYVTITLDVIVRNAAGTGTKTNNAYITIPNPASDDGDSNLPPFACSVDTNGEIGTSNQATDVNLLDLADGNDDGSTPPNVTKMCVTSNGVNVIDISYMASEKLVKGALDTQWSKYPYFGKTYHGGTAQYTVTVINTGNIAVDNIEILDILPYVGDTGIIGTNDRLSEFQVSLTEPFNVANATVSYSLLKDPCRADYMGSEHEGCMKPYWTTTPFKDITQARSIKIDFDAGFTLQPDENVSFTFDVVVPVDAPEGAIAWNSFGYLGKRVDDGTALIPSEPIKVGITVPAETQNSYGDYVWIDMDHDGIQDSDEAGVNGIKVQLFNSSDTLIATTYTSTDHNGNLGKYGFGDLPDGDYYATFELPDGYTADVNDASSTPDTGDSDVAEVNATHVKTGTTTLSGGEKDITWDVGIYPDATHAAVGDYVWFDNNKDGLQNDSNASDNIVVLLRDENDVLIDSTATSKTGKYLFYDGVEPDKNYYILFVTHDEYGLTYENQGVDDSVDSDANNTKRTPLFQIGTGNIAPNEDPDFNALTQNNVNLSVDGGLVISASLGDYVWYDKDADGIQDSGEHGISGVKITLWRELDSVVAATATTDADGKYLFENLIPGDYNVTFDWSSVDPATHPYQVSAANQGGNTAKDSDGLRDASDTQKAYTISTTIDSEESDLSWDLGLYRHASIGDIVWLDNDGNGQQNSEVAVSGVEVNLYNGIHAQITVDDLGNTFGTAGTITTAVDGLYKFDNLKPGSYYVEFVPSSLPVNHVFTRKDTGSNASDSDADRSSGKTATTTLTSNENDMSWDAGIFEPASIGDYVWIDNDGNGIQGNPGDTDYTAGATVGLNNVNFSNFDVDGNAFSTDTTDASGNYGFSSLYPGSYEVTFTLPSGYMWTLLNAGSDDALDSDVTAGSLTVTELLTSGESNSTIDAGILEPASISNYVWLDVDTDGIQDAGESPLSGVKVYLLDSSDNEITNQTTGADGLYKFDMLFPGTYRIKIDLPDGYYVSPKDAGGDDAVDNDIDPATLQAIQKTLVAGENDDTWDIGLYEVASIGNFVWLDKDADGIQDAGEVGVSGVKVSLKNSSGNSVNDTTGSQVSDITTDGSGNYKFELLDPGSYKVCFDTTTASPGYQISEKDAGSDDGVDSDVDSVTMCTELETLVAGENNDTLDMGIYKNVASLGDIVWYDTNQNGIQDGGESGVADINVTLLDDLGNVLDTTTTDANGNYSFTDLKPDFYEVEFNLTSLPSGDVATYANQLFDDTVDSDADRVSGKTGQFQLFSDENNLTLDMGIFELGSLGNYIWYDENRDGVQDAGENGIVGITVNLLDSAGNPALDSGGSAMTTTTDADGHYLFEDLYAGDYIVEVVAPFGYVVSPEDNSSTTDILDSDINTTSKKTELITIESGTHDMSNDAGMYIPYASIGDRVWHDLNRNGIQDGGELGVSDVKVELYDSTYSSGDDNTSSSYMSATLTDNDGHYAFTELIPDSYSVKFIKPDGYLISAKTQGSDTLADSDADTVTGIATVPTLSADENDMSWDMGIYLYAKIGDKVWIDSNGNGIQDAGENGLDGVAVTLTRKSDSASFNTATAGGGLYLFENLEPDAYDLSFVMPTGYEITLANVGDDAKDSDINSTLKTIVTTLDSNESDMTWDVGVVERASLGDTVWRDDNRDGIQDASEPKVQGVIVNLLDSGENILATDTTDANGYYEFTNLFPADYIVEFNLTSLPTHFVPTLQNQGSDDAKDSDANPTTGKTNTIALLSGENNVTMDMGINIPITTIGDKVWNDTNLNGLQDNGEVGVANVTVTLLDENGDSVTDAADVAVAPTTTNSSGNYNFTNLVPGDYMLEFTLPTGYGLTVMNNGADSEDSDVNATTMRTAVTTLDAQEQDMTWDMGIYEFVSLGDRVWEDLNRNGIAEEGESGVQNITVHLLNASGTVLDTTTTDSSGNYLFEELQPTQYRVLFDPSSLPQYYVITPQDKGANDTNDSDADTSTGLSHLITLSGGEHDPSIDMGINLPQTTIGDKVWHDANGDGIQDATEAGVMNVTVELLDAGGNVQETTTTDVSGLYEFDDLYPGDYRVRFTMPNGYGLSPQDSTSDDKDSDVDATTLTTPTTTLTIGEYETSLDMGIYLLGSIGDTIWHDDNADTNIDNSEDRLANVTVILEDSLGNTVTTTTDSNGNYLFADVSQGDYVVSVDESTLPSGSDWATTTFNTPMNVALAPEENFLDADFGYDFDGDDDGIADNIEVPPYTDPETGEEVSTPPSTVTDENGDGLDDNTGEPVGEIDVDGDGIPNHLDEDSDNDGIPDTEEMGDRDGDGVPDYLDYDPQGWFYDQDTGEVIPGGKVEVTCTDGAIPNPVTQTSGDSGYTFAVTSIPVNGTECTMVLTAPPHYVLSPDYNASTSPGECTVAPGDTFMGQDRDANTNFLTAFDISANQPFCIKFYIDQDSGNVYHNNIPLKVNPVTVPTLSEWGRIFMILSMMVMAIYYIRRRQYSL